MPPALAPDLRTRIEQRLRDGATTPEIVADLPVSPATVRRIAQAIGLRRRAGRPPSREQRIGQIERLRVGNDIGNIAYILGLAESTIRRYASDGKKKKTTLR